MSAEQGAEAQQAPQMRDTMQRQNLNADHLKNTDGSPPIKAQMGVNSSLPKMQIGANNTEKDPWQMTQMTQSDSEEAQIDTECSRERSARLITCWR
jgi:hypothetical protein